MLCLVHATDPAWARRAVDALPAVLVDHAHCEMKAATNAMSLVPRAAGHPEVVRALVDLAHEELQHFRLVLDEIERSGGSLGLPEVDDYAAELRKRAAASAKGRPQRPGAWLVERLLVGALIEARSCERFRLLAAELERRDERRLAELYGELLASEARHYTTFVELAVGVDGDERAVRARLEELAILEGDLAARGGMRATIHG